MCHALRLTVADSGVLPLTCHSQPKTVEPLMLRNGMFQFMPGSVWVTPKIGPLVVEVAYTHALAEIVLLLPNVVPSVAVA